MRTKTLFVVALLLAVTLPGCVPEVTGGTGGGSTPPPRQDPIPSPKTTPPPDPIDALLEQIAADLPGPCPDPDYRSIGYTGLTDSEAKVYADVLVCDHRNDIPVPNGKPRTFLANTSDGVWYFTGPANNYRVYQPTDKANFFRWALRDQIFQSVLDPNLAIMVPGESITVINTTEISWIPHVELTAAWATQDFSSEFLQERGVDYLALTLQRRTGHSAAIPKCMLAAYKATESNSEIEPTSDLVDRTQNQLKATSAATSCATAMREADQGADALRNVPKARGGTWIQHVDTLAGQVDNGLQVGKYLTWAAGACKIIPRC
ncbi:hypothetical protein [Paenarthrobacter nitroguajacolicus]|uniref:hypothetical protein n=1 Tax=Paenarthrobacter nitroguajacolicus TaxID=211146 RepID=UPI0015B985CD|nr:hypothetical protein [Paenarthrobacter nitroguajacolicus]